MAAGSTSTRTLMYSYRTGLGPSAESEPIGLPAGRCGLGMGDGRWEICRLGRGRGDSYRKQKVMAPLLVGLGWADCTVRHCSTLRVGVTVLVGGSLCELGQVASEEGWAAG